MLAENSTIDWHPEYIRDGRLGEWLANNVDWALSRDRYWGTPLPIWRCEDGHLTCVASRDELSDLAGTDLSDLEPHRPEIDEVVFACPTCANEARRVEPVIDAWFDSGSMPAAQVGLPARRRQRRGDAVPGPVHRRGDRPDARLVLLAARRQHAGLWRDALRARALPRPHRRRDRQEDEQVASATSSTPGRCSTRGARTRCAGGCSPRARRGPRRARASARSTRRCARRSPRCGTRSASLRPTPRSTSSIPHDADDPAPRGPQRHRPVDPLAHRERDRHGHGAPSTATSRSGAPTRWSSSSTTCPTGTCGAVAAGSGVPTPTRRAPTRSPPRRRCSRSSSA